MSKKSRVKVLETKHSRKCKSVSFSTSNISSLETCQPLKIGFEFSQKYLEELQFLGLFDSKIIVTYSKRLHQYCLFDQHAIHERIRYEYYLRKLREQMRVPTTVNLHVATKKQLLDLPPSTIQFRPPHKIRKLLTDLRKVLIPVNQQQPLGQYWGFSFQRIHNQVYCTQCPVLLDREFSSEDLVQFFRLHQISWNSLPSLIDSVLCSFSCKAAIKFGCKIDNILVVKLVKALCLVDYPFHCVHGRASFLAVDKPRKNVVRSRQE